MQPDRRRKRSASLVLDYNEWTHRTEAVADVMRISLPLPSPRSFVLDGRITSVAPPIPYTMLSLPSAGTRFVGSSSVMTLSTEPSKVEVIDVLGRQEEMVLFVTCP